MIIVQDKHPVGIMVDSVMEVLTLPKKDIEANPESLIVDKSEAVLGVAKHDKELIILLDFLKVASKNVANMKEILGVSKFKYKTNQNLKLAHHSISSLFHLLICGSYGANQATYC